MVQMKVENDIVEQHLPTAVKYLYIIIIKLALLTALKVVKIVFKIHASYKKSLKRKYTAKDVEAQKPTPTPSTRSGGQ